MRLVDDDLEAEVAIEQVPKQKLAGGPPDDHEGRGDQRRSETSAREAMQDVIAAEHAHERFDVDQDLACAKHHEADV
jgi:hypothetical protein